MNKGLSILLLFALIVSIFSFPSVSFGCSCMKPPPAEDAYEESDAVFTGIVSSIDVHSTTQTVSFDVTKSFKGANENIKIETATNSAACGVFFELGKEYLVYAYGDGEYETNLCTRTTDVAAASDDLLVLNELSPNAEQYEQSSNRQGSIIPIIVIILILAFFAYGFYWYKKRAMSE